METEGQLHAREKKWPRTTIFCPIFDLVGKTNNSGALRFCIWPFYTFPCDMSSILWKLWDDSAKLRKKRQKSRRLPQYLTVGEKIINCNKWRFCLWPFQTFPCDNSSILWKLWDVYAKVWKSDRKRWVFQRYLTLRAIYQNSFPLRFGIWPSTHFHVTLIRSYENSVTSSLKYEKTNENDDFLPHCNLDLLTLRPRPGYYSIQGAYAPHVSWNSDIGKVVKNPGQRDRWTSVNTNLHHDLYRRLLAS